MSFTEKQTAALQSAQRYFNDGLYDRAIPLLNGLLAQKVMSPDVYHMLGTINYEQGQFKSSIVSFKKALHIDPYFTDSSIGLSVVLNDLGKYQQAQEIFKDAQDRLKDKNVEPGNVNLDNEIAQKHLELSELYAKANNPTAAFSNLISYEDLTAETLETTLKKADLQRSLSNFSFGAEILKSWWADDPNINNAKFFTKLAELYYLDRKVVAALEACEHGLMQSSTNQELLNLKDKLTQTEFNLRPSEI